jgi:glutaredoxin
VKTGRWLEDHVSHVRAIAQVRLGTWELAFGLKDCAQARPGLWSETNEDSESREALTGPNSLGAYIYRIAHAGAGTRMSENTGRDARAALLFRMVLPEHTCPYGVKAKELLEREGYEVEDRHLTTREETEAFKKQHSVSTTPQIFIDNERIGGYDDLQRLIASHHQA